MARHRKNVAAGEELVSMVDGRSKAESSSRSLLVQKLSRQIKKIERSQRVSSAEDVFSEGLFSTGIVGLDELLPGGGLARGTLLEWLAVEGGGAGMLVMQLVARVIQRQGVFVVIDPLREFYPPAASNLGVQLEQITIVRPANSKDTLWAFEQSLRCPAATVSMCRLERLTDHVFRRLQLAAEAGGGMGFLLRPANFRSHRCWADARLLVEPSPVTSQSDWHGWRLHVELLHCRGRMSGGGIELEISDETDHVHLVPRLASTTNPRRAARA